MVSVRGTSLGWLKSYLAKRTHYICDSNINSKFLPVTCRDPQGSIQGSLLFIIYVNDIAKLSIIMELILFADDTSVFMSRFDLDILVECVDSELEEIARCFRINKVSLHLNKTNCIVFALRGRRATYKYLDIKIYIVKIERVTSTKFLGVTISPINPQFDYCNIILASYATTKTCQIIQKTKKYSPNNQLALNFSLQTSISKIKYFNYKWNKPIANQLLCVLDRPMSLN